MAIKQNPNSNSLFKFSKKHVNLNKNSSKKIFKNRLISCVKRRLLIFVNRHRYYSKKRFKIKSYYHRRLRVIFVNRIRYRRLLIPFIRFNHLRILAIKSYRLRAKAAEILNSVNRFNKSLRNLSRRISKTRSIFNRLELWFLTQYMPELSFCELRSFWLIFGRSNRLLNRDEIEYFRLRLAFQNLFSHLVRRCTHHSRWMSLMSFFSRRLRKSKSFRLRFRSFLKLHRFKSVRQKRLIGKGVHVEYSKALFKFAKRFHKLSVLKHYIGTLLTQFRTRDWIRFKKVHLKRSIYPQHRKVRLDLFKTSTKRYLGGALTTGVYDNLFSGLLYKGLVFHSLKYSSSKVYWKFLTRFIRVGLIHKLRGGKFREQGSLKNYPNYRFVNQIKRIRFIVRRNRLSRYRLMISKALKRFTVNNFSKTKHQRYLFSFLRSFFLRRDYLTTRINLVVKEFKRLYNFVLVNKQNSRANRFKSYKKNYLIRYIQSKLNNYSVSLSIIPNRMGLRLTANFINNYLFDVITSNIRSLRFLGVINGINSQLLATVFNFFPYSQIVTRKYLKDMRSLLISSKLKISHLRFLSNYYNFYSFRIFLRPLINRAYYAQISTSGLTINQNLNNLSETRFVGFNSNRTVMYTSLETEFSDVTPFFNLNESKAAPINLEVEETLTPVIYSDEFLRSARYLREVKANRLQLLSLLLAALISCGKKKKAASIFFSLIGLMKFKYRLNYLNEYVRFLSLLRPVLRYRNMYIGGKKYKIPLLLTPDRGYRVAIRWYVNNSTGTGRSINELFENFNKTLSNQGDLLKIRREHHLISFENKSYVRFLRFFKQGF